MTGRTEPDVDHQEETGMKKFTIRNKDTVSPSGSGRKNQKKRRRVIVSISVATAAAVAGSVFYSYGRKTQVHADDGTQTDVQEATASTGTVSSSITGTGTLESADGDAVTIPSGLTITEVEVASGDTVSKGDVLAKVDHSSVLSAMDSVQDAIDEVDEQIAAITDDTEEEEVTAGVSGTVTAIYASEGTSVSDTLTASGALAEIAIGGDTDQIVQVTATDGTVSDIDVAVGDTVDTGDTLMTVTVDENSEKYAGLMSERAELTAELQALVKISETDEITATSDGTIASVNVSASGSSSASSGSSMSSAGSASGTSSTGSSTASTASYADDGSVSAVLANVVTSVTALTDTDGDASSDTLEIVRSADTAVTAGTGVSFTVSSSSSSADGSAAFVLTAPKTGEKPVTTLEAADHSWTATVVWTDSDGNTLSSSDTFEAGKTYRAGVTVTPAEGCALNLNSITSVSGYTISGMALKDDGTLQFVLTAPETASGTSSSGTSENGKQNGSSSSASSDAGDAGGAASGSSETGSSGTSASGSAGAESSAEESGKTSASGISASGSSASMSSTAGSSVSGSASSGSSGSAAVSSDTSSSDEASDFSSGSDSTAASDAAEVTAFTMQSDDTMTLSVSVDELDINSVEVGQTATVTMDALEDVTLDGTVTSVSNSASSSGNGSAKYTVEISVPKQDGMLIGMSASATIVVEESKNVVTLPVDALQEKGNETYVYTSVDGDGNLSGETEVETGLSDGDTVEITDGLSDGDTVYYEKTGNTTSASAGMGGEMPSGGNGGEMPSGGGDKPSDSGNGGMPSGGMPSGNGGGAPSGS